ncbi:DUF916 and DUF3324 domain-containing protein [Enterococcus sp. DIV1298c]|uniref:DUF916 and DUF3324 domain-containing protein n=1 Tax=Enterococcus sp. DIV1298c TaxID=2815328 RepID=UPI003241C6D9
MRDIDTYERFYFKSYIGGILLILTAIFIPLKVVAAEESLDFYVTPEFSESQVDGNVRYFDMNAEPGSVQKLTLNLKNGNARKKKVQITAHTAFTNVLGSVEYGKNAEFIDPTLEHSLEDLIEPIEPIELAANESKNVEITLNMPTEQFNGLLAGGLRIAEINDDIGEETKEDSLTLTNEFVYIIGVLVSNNRSSVQPYLELQDVFADQLNYHNVISAQIQNITPTFINKLVVDATVRRKNENEILYRTQKENMQMAPNSSFNFPISLNGEKFESGDYILELVAQSGKDIWEWKREFEIETDVARELNRTDVTVTDNNELNTLVVSILLIILILTIIWLFLKSRIKE